MVTSFTSLTPFRCSSLHSLDDIITASGLCGWLLSHTVHKYLLEAPCWIHKRKESSSRRGGEDQPKRLHYCPGKLQKPADREDVKDVLTANFSLSPKGIWHGEKLTLGIPRLKVKSQDEHYVRMCFDWVPNKYEKPHTVLHTMHVTTVRMFVECSVPGHELEIDDKIRRTS